MLTRTHDPAGLHQFKKDDWVRFDPDELLSDEDNVCLTDGNNYGLAELVSPGVYRGHFLFTDRGNKALQIAQDMIQYMYREYDAKIFVGLTPKAYLGAIWLNKRLGFKSHGDVETLAGPCELFILERPN
jgi:hypothetical protein